MKLRYKEIPVAQKGENELFIWGIIPQMAHSVPQHISQVVGFLFCQ
jgi:hypothetical protein